MTEHITVPRELLRQAIEALENGKRVRNAEGGTKFQPPLEDASITALRNALSGASSEAKEQPAAQKPDRTGMRYYRNDRCTAANADAPDCICWTPITPPQAQQHWEARAAELLERFNDDSLPEVSGSLGSQMPRQPQLLTDEEIDGIVRAEAGYGNNFDRVARAIEQAVHRKMGVGNE